jgi:hypothetical protein
MQTDNQVKSDARTECDSTGSRPAPCSAAGYWNEYPKDKPEEEGWYLVWHGGGPEASGYLQGFSQAYYTPKRDDWEAADPNDPIADGCMVTHWAYVKPPNARDDAYRTESVNYGLRPSRRITI